MQGCFLDMAIGYINTELDLLCRYDRTQEELPQSGSLHRWTGTVVELVELMIYALHEMKRIGDGKMVIFFGRIFGIKLKAKCFYNVYMDIKRHKNYFLDKMRKRMNLWMQRDDERELKVSDIQSVKLVFGIVIRLWTYLCLLHNFAPSKVSESFGNKDLCAADLVK